jgi:hypothetical protein
MTQSLSPTHRKSTPMKRTTYAAMLVTAGMVWLLGVLVAAEPRSKDSDARAGADPNVIAPSVERLRARISWGHQATAPQAFRIGFSTHHAAIERLIPEDFEPEDTMEGGTAVTRAGAGDVDVMIAEVTWSQPMEPPRPVQSIWQYLLDHGEPGQVRRLRDDPGLQPDAPLLTVVTAADGTRGFSIGLEQLMRHRALWLPDHDVFVTLADAPVDFARHLASLEGERVLDRVKRGSEATLAEWTSKWEDVGNPDDWNQPWEVWWLGTRGHLVGTVARHGSLYKFGIDRWGSVRPDFASPHRFRFDPLWPDCRWAGQHIVDGLPIVVTDLERAGHRCQLEQFAAVLPLTLNKVEEPRQAGRGYPRGEIASVVMTRVRISGEGPVSLGFRLATESTNRHPELREVAGQPCMVDRETGAILLMIEPGIGLEVRPRAPIDDPKDPRIEFDLVGNISPGQTYTALLKLPSPVVERDDVARLAGMDFERARADTIAYWENWLAQGARFEVPETEVNHLFRANLWHALMLPRHRTDEHGVARIDLPYSNFAYGQYNADWPINQAVYVSYMIHGLRGHFAVAEEEFAAMFHTQQRPNGRVGGYAEWGVYTPGMLYSIGQNYLLSGDRASFERLLPASLKALDWCLEEIERGQDSTVAPGLIVAPLNDLTHDARAWAFPNGYFVAGLDIFGRALALHGHQRAAATRAAAARMRADVERAFARASIQAPVVQLADGTWQNYVPCDAMTPRRMLDEWYPTDVDTGALHLSRLAAIDPRGWLTSWLLHDHEDNLFLNQWGMANEPIYNQHATTYLYRDEPEAAIRAFYSMMACAFSHHQFSPLEHRWAWYQYFGPPSTDGAWFELYRNLLLNELRDEQTLFIGQAIPRAWLANGKRVVVERAPTYFGPVNVQIESAVRAGNLTARIEFLGDRRPDTMLVRFRHPERATLRSVRVNGSVWTDFDIDQEWVRIPNPEADHFTVVAGY